MKGISDAYALRIPHLSTITHSQLSDVCEYITPAHKQLHDMCILDRSVSFGLIVNNNTDSQTELMRATEGD
jgi:hypothetical protein